MIQIQHNFNLKAFNTFGIDIQASEYIACHIIDDIMEALKHLSHRQKSYLILGGGSNILFSKAFDGIVIHPLLNKIKVVKESSEHIWVEVEAGAVWDDFVAYCVDKDWYGIENLSYIPGNIGASPVQNIGAYGVEVKDCIEDVKGIYIDKVESFQFSNKDCQFGYRQSIFKSELKNKVIITSVVFRLSKVQSFKLDYGSVKAELEKKGELTLHNVRNAIIDIRKSKLPEPEELGNAGSFFKNPVISKDAFNILLKEYNEVPNYPVNNNMIKVPAGWLIDQAGWKGKSMGNAAVHTKQALVLVNQGNAKGSEVISLANAIIDDIKSKFNIVIEPEVNIL